MRDFMLTNEPTIRLAFYLGVLVAMAVWELIAPRRHRLVSRGFRWINNLGLVVVSTVVLRIVFPMLAVGVAAWAEGVGWGLLNIIPMPRWLAVLCSVVLLDLLIYWQHVAAHSMPHFWLLHMVHHADPDIDTTTGIRFHPLEIVISMLIKMAAVFILGAPAEAVILFEVVLNATAMFNHGNVRLPARLDGWLRQVVVTPDMHRVHHSVVVRETNSNFGFNLSVWDHLFGTYCAQPEAGHVGITIGLKQFQSEPRQTLWWMLALPFKGDKGNYPMTRGGPR